MKNYCLIPAVILSLWMCSAGLAQSPSGSSITAPTEGQEYSYGVTSIAIEGTITLTDSVANVVTTWPTGQVTTAQVTYGAGSVADQWMVINSRVDANGTPNGHPMYVGNYVTKLVDYLDSTDVWDTVNYEVLEPTNGGPIYN